MSDELPISSPYRSTPGAPVSEAEREQLSGRLNAAYEAGSLAPEDYQARLDILFAAQTLGQLVPVVDGLPPSSTYDSPAIVATQGGKPGELATARSASGLAVVAVAGVVGLIVLIVVLLAILI